MSDQSALCDLASDASFNAMVRILSSKRYAEVVDEYCSMLEDDPNYLSYHWQSAALKLHFLLKLHDLPSLNIGGCINTDSSECCIVEALKEAIRLRSSGRSAVRVGDETKQQNGGNRVRVLH